MSAERPLRRVVIKEELVALTEDFMEALVLNQFLYWTSRVRDYDQLLQEEAIRTSPADDVTLPAPRHGWIYKKAEDLGEELMVGRSATTIRRIITRLVERGWLSESNSPHMAWDKTKQYRVNLATLRQDLATLGYPLDDYKLSTENCEQPTQPKPKNAASSATNDDSNAQELAPTCTMMLQTHTMKEQYQRILQKLSVKKKQKVNKERITARPRQAGTSLTVFTLFLTPQPLTNKRPTPTQKATLKNLRPFGEPIPSIRTSGKLGASGRKH